MPLPSALRIPLLLIVLILPVLLLAIVQGEFLYKRLAAILVVATRSQMKRPRDIVLTDSWTTDRKEEKSAVPIITSDTIING